MCVFIINVAMVEEHMASLCLGSADTCTWAYIQGVG